MYNMYSIKKYHFHIIVSGVIFTEMFSQLHADFITNSFIAMEAADHQHLRYESSLLNVWSKLQHPNVQARCGFSKAKKQIRRMATFYLQ